MREKPRQFLALTSLEVTEFDELLTDFTPAWERHHRWHTLEGKRRQFAAHRERPNAVLAGSDVKLFFLLTYLKSNSLQQHQAASFGVSQARVSQLATGLLAVRNQVLARRGLARARRSGAGPTPGRPPRAGLRLRWGGAWRTAQPRLRSASGGIQC